MKNYFLKKLNKKIRDDFEYKDDYSSNEIERIDGAKMTNHFTFDNEKCHQNSNDLYKRNNNMKVKLCYIYHKHEKNNGHIHFINYDSENDVYIDNTLGGESIFWIYYIIKENWLQERLDKNPNYWLGWAKEDIYNRYCTNFIWRLFTNEDQL